MPPIWKRSQIHAPYIFFGSIEDVYGAKRPREYIFVIKFVGLDKAIIGQASVWLESEKVDRLVYSADKMVKIFMSQGMNEEEALEWIDYNVEGAYLGPETPVVVWSEYE